MHRMALYRKALTFLALPKPCTLRDKRYLGWIRTLDCAVCGRKGPNDPHHVNKEGHGGKGIKGDDTRAIPLCNEHHREFHDKGRLTFAERHGIDYEITIEALNRVYRIRTGPV